MRVPSVGVTLLVALVGLTLVSSGLAQAQTDIVKKAIAKAEATAENLRASCEQDVKQYCSKVTMGEGRLILCMMAHEDKISDRCYGAMFDVADGIEMMISNVKRAADQCEEDAEKLCGSVEPGEGRIAQCLVENKAKVSTGCRAEIAAVEARLKK